jgi:hypothetical protein
MLTTLPPGAVTTLTLRPRGPVLGRLAVIWAPWQSVPGELLVTCTPCCQTMTPYTLRESHYRHNCDLGCNLLVAISESVVARRRRQTNGRGKDDGPKFCSRDRHRRYRGSFVRGLYHKRDS